MVSAPSDYKMKNKSKLFVTGLGVALALVTAISIHAAGKNTVKSAGCCAPGAACCVPGAPCCPGN